jgi:hypothetical protein
LQQLKLLQFPRQANGKMTLEMVMEWAIFEMVKKDMKADGKKGWRAVEVSFILKMVICIVVNFKIIIDMGMVFCIQKMAK